MTARIRAATEADAEPCGRIIFEAFKGIAEQHAFPLDFPSPEIAIQLAQSFIADTWIFGVVAEKDGVQHRDVLIRLRSMLEEDLASSTEAVDERPQAEGGDNTDTPPERGRSGRT